MRQAVRLKSNRNLLVAFLFATLSCRDQGAKKTNELPAVAASSAATPASSPAPRPDGAARGPKVFVSNEDSNDISVIDSFNDAVIGTIFVGKRPRGLRLSPDGKILYVALSGSPKDPPGVRDGGKPAVQKAADRAADGIALVDVEKGLVIKNLPSGQDPEAFDLMPDGKIMYVSNEEIGQASVLDLVSGSIIKTVKLGDEPEGVTVKPTGDVVYVTSEATNMVFVIDTRDNSVKTTIETGPRPRSVVFTPDGARGYITEEQGASVSVVDAIKHKLISKIKLDDPAAKPMGATVAPDGKTVFVTTGRGGSVVYIDVPTSQITKTIRDVGTRPWGIGATPAGDKLYTANGPSGDVSVIDVATARVISRIKVGSFPWGVAVAR